MNNLETQNQTLDYTKTLEPSQQENKKTRCKNRLNNNSVNNNDAEESVDVIKIKNLTSKKHDNDDYALNRM